MNSNKEAAKILVDVKINVKTKLSALWASLMFLYLYGDYFTLYVPGKLEGMIAEKFVNIQTTEGVLLAAAVLMAVPGLMVFLSLVLKPKVNRWVNIVVSITVGVINFLTMLMGAWIYYMFLGTVEIAINVLIVWYAWKWPEQDP